jgi:hypothetical protein
LSLELEVGWIPRLFVESCNGLSSDQWCRRCRKCVCHLKSIVEEGCWTEQIRSSGFAKDIPEIVEVAVVEAEVYTSLRSNTSEFGSIAENGNFCNL